MMPDDDWSRLFPASDYRPAMNLRVIDGHSFFATRDPEVLEMRREMLRTAPAFYLAGKCATASLARYLALPDVDPTWEIEPDWVLLQANPKGEYIVEGGCVCFPTMWSLPEKIGLPLAAVHGPVPGLNAALGQKIDHFLTRLAQGTAYGRENWGLSASDALDQHPRHRLPAILPLPELEEVWLRIEQQVLIRLDDARIVFGIRLVQHRLDRLTPPLASGLARALRTMPEAMAKYKRLTACRACLSTRLDLLGTS